MPETKRFMENIRFADSSLSNEERPRLGAQNQAILTRLRQGPATNTELAEIALKYSSRISDLRKAGYNVVCASYSRKTGIAVYELRGAA